MSRCGNICIMPPKCSREERRHGFSNRSSVDAAVSGRSCVFLGESKSTLFGLLKVDVFRIIMITYNRTATHFMDDCFMNLGEEVILTVLWQSGASESASVSIVISWSICYWLFKCRVLRVVCVCVRERERETGSHHSGVSCLNRCFCANTHSGYGKYSDPLKFFTLCYIAAIC